MTESSSSTLKLNSSLESASSEVGDVESQAGKSSKAGLFSCCCAGESKAELKQKDKRLYAKTTIRELIMYLIFLTVLCILAFGMTSPTMYLFTNSLTNVFINAPFDDQGTTFKTMATVEDFWQFAENTLIDGLHWEYWYGNGADKVVLTDDIDRNILYENKILGVPRLRQLRVRNDSCAIPEAFTKTIPVCYAEYSEKFEDRSLIGDNDTDSNWKYFSASKLGGTLYWGKLTYYGGGGFVQLLGKNRSQTSDIIDNLKQSLWINRGTRAVFIDFTVYNANVNLFCIVKLVVEFPATGGVVTSYSLRTAKLIRYVEPFDFFILACEAVFTLFTLVYIIEELIEFCRSGCSYFKHFWNWIDGIVIVLSIVCIFFSVMRYWIVSALLQTLLSNTSRSPDFDQLAFWQMVFNQVAALCVFFAWIKVFKYISFNKTMSQMSTTLSKCSKDIMGFAIMFFIVFFAFAQLGYLLFGTQIGDYSSFENAIFTLFRTIMGDFDYLSLENANRVLGPLFFMSFIFFVFFVLLNMFLAIIAETYTTVKEQSEGRKPDLELAEYFRGTLSIILAKMGRRQDSNIENAVSYGVGATDGANEDLRQRLKKSGFSDMEIEVFLNNKVQNTDPTTSPTQEVTSEACETRLANISADNVVSVEEFAELYRRVDVMEHSVGSIVDKIDMVLGRLETMDKSKHKRREAMGKILDTITENDSMDEATKRRQIESLMRSELETNGSRF